MNALSRLSQLKEFEIVNDDKIKQFNQILMTMNNVTATFELDENIKIRLRQNIISDQNLSNIIQQIEIQMREAIIKKKSIINKTRQLYVYWLKKNDVLYHMKRDKSRRICVSSSLQREIMTIIYNNMKYLNFNKSLSHLRSAFYFTINNEFLQRYIRHCSSYQLTKTSFHWLYEKMHSISLFSKSFKITFIDFVTELSLSNEYDCLMTMMKKFNRAIQLISNKIIWKDAKWIK